MTEIKCPEIDAAASNWWYHYFCEGSSKLLDEKPQPAHFIRADYKVTPDFNKMTYCYGWCHPQIGLDPGLTEGKSVIVLKTSAGQPPWSYIVGFYRVHKIHGRERESELWMLRREHKELVVALGKAKSDAERQELERKRNEVHGKLSDFYITMDPKCSLLLLGCPINIDLNLAKRLWPLDLFSRDKLVQQVSSRLRNARASEKQLEILLHELFQRHRSGCNNYMGVSYQELCNQRQWAWNLEKRNDSCRGKCL